MGCVGVVYVRDRGGECGCGMWRGVSGVCGTGVCMWV